MRNLMKLCMIVSTAGLIGCGDSANEDGDGQLSEPGGSISGSVSVLPQETRTSFVEQEPNDTLNDAGAPITVQTQTRLEIFGSLSTLTGDLSDSFQFQVAPNSERSAGRLRFKARQVRSSARSVQSPQRQRRHVFNEQAVSRNRRLGPCLAVGHFPATQKIEPVPTRVDDKHFRVVL